MKEKLESGISVLYSGTPCQIDALNTYLGKTYDNLLTVDIVCHGVPNNHMFKDYITALEKKYNRKIYSFKFRDKKLGWGKNGSIDIICGSNKMNIKLWESATPYLYYFGKGWLNRDSCYKCKYACSHRPADITLGDYWGIEKQHPEFLKKNVNEKMGISLVISNTAKGEEYIEYIKNLTLIHSSIEKAKEANNQLSYPSSKGKRNIILKDYLYGGWEYIDRKFEKNTLISKYSSFIKSIIPLKIKRYLKSNTTINKNSF